MPRKATQEFVGGTPTSTSGVAGYAVLGSGYGADASPSECNGRHPPASNNGPRSKGKVPMPAVLGPVLRPSPVVLGETRPRNNSGYGIPMLGSTPKGPAGNARRQGNNSGFGSYLAQRRMNNLSAMSNQRSSFMPSNSALGASGFNPGASGFNPGASGFNPGASGFNPNASGGVRPSRQMNRNELSELKDFLWKANASIGPSGRPRNLSAANANDNQNAQCAAPGAQLPFYAQNFDTGTQRAMNEHQTAAILGGDDEDDVAFMPLPRESVAIMVDAVRTSTLGDDEKCRFLFELFDIEHRGVLTKEGVRAFVEATLATNGIEFMGAFNFDAVVDKVFAHARDPNKLTYSEFKQIFGSIMTETDDNKSREQIVELAAIQESTRSNRAYKNAAAHEAAAMLLDPEENGGRWYRFKKFCRMYSGQIFWVTLYIALMIGVAIAKGSRFGYDPAVKYCPRIAKGFAEICLVNTMFVLMPMCRNFVTALRTLPIVVNHLPVDDHIEFHKICGIVMIIASLGHTGAWLAIVYYVRTVPLDVWKESKYYHLSFVRDENLLEFALRIPIWTGVVMLICAAVAAPLCHPKFRRGNFNVFWISHLLFIPFLALMMLHGVAAWVAAPQAYYWVLPPILVYMIEKRYRMAHVFGGRARISNVQLSKEAVAIFMKKPKMFGKRQRFQPGMYMFINVPAISQFEWHPFTISSAPEDKFLSLHIRKAGDWTGTFYDMLEKLKTQNETNQIEAQNGYRARGSPYPTIYIDGPVGAPAQDYARYKEVVLIGAGIGVTPFASILRSLMHQWESYRCEHCRHVRFPPSFQLRKIYFYWITREQEALSWFANTMNQLSEMDTENRLEIHNYFTSVKNKSVIAPLQALQNFIHETEGEDIISGLHTKQQTHFGRPDWKQELERVAANHRAQFGGNGEVGTDDEDDDENDREEIGVFFCGPKPLGNVIHEQCAQFNQSKIRWTPDVMFDFHSENF